MTRQFKYFFFRKMDIPKLINVLITSGIPSNMDSQINKIQKKSKETISQWKAL